MANRSSIMGLHGLRNKVHKNSFDLSYRNLFTAKVGELLPCFVQELNPGDSIKVDSSYFTRTAPLQTAAFTRLRENVQFFFVPYSLLWKYFNSQVTNMTKNANGGDISRVADGITSNQSVTTQMPYVNYKTLHEYLLNIMDHSTNPTGSAAVTPTEDTFPEYFNNGEYRWCASAKLLQLLGYGNFEEQNIGLGSADFNADGAPNLSVFRLLAYHKICNDHYTYRQWQPYNASLCNIDYLKPSSSASLDLSSSLLALSSRNNANFKKLNFTDLRFSNLPLDYFNGVLPTAQYGSESVVNFNVGSASGTASLSGTTSKGKFDSSYYQSVYDSHGNILSSQGNLQVNSGALRLDDSSSSSPVYVKTGINHTHDISASASINTDLSGSLSVIALRNALAAQKYKEIQLASDADFVSQVEAHFGVKPKHDNDTSIFIGGSSSMIDINPQVNQNLAGSDDANQANVKASPVGNGSAQIKFTADTYGVVIGIYRCVPVLDYAHIGIDRILLKTDASDFVIPELDSIGMQQTFGFEVAAPGIVPAGQPIPTWFDMSKTYGYAPRYSEYKTSYDRYNGAFCYTMKDWVTGLNTDKIIDFLKKGSSLSLDAVELFNCRPDLVKSIFVNQKTLTSADDNLFVGMVNMCYATRSLSRYGLPYSD